jgi:hypothetical protein
VATSLLFLPHDSKLKLSKRHTQTHSTLWNLWQECLWHLTKLCIVRVFSVLDWDVAPFTLGRAIAKLIDENSKFKLRNGDDVRDFLTPRSIANILEKLVEELSLPTIINLCSGVGIKVAVAARTMLAGSGYEIPEHRILPGNSSNPYIVGNNSKLTKLFPNMDLSWSPSIRI